MPLYVESISGGSFGCLKSNKQLEDDVYIESQGWSLKVFVFIIVSHLHFEEAKVKG
jgi:hypothetical protein